MPKSPLKESEINPQAFKHLFNKELLKRISKSVSGVYSKFDQQHFMGLMPLLEPLEMKPRVQLLREELKKLLPQDYGQSLQILLKSARTGTLKGFDLWPYSDFVQTYGLEEIQLSLDALQELTPLFSSEFAVRPFLRQHPKQTLKYLMECTQNTSVDIRRWASEGSRPRLPWGERLHDFVQDPTPTLLILEKLKFDPELYVRKSVSNHLNDIAKDHPERVIEVLSYWRKSAIGTDHAKNVEWITHRALRTLIKAGHPEALKLIGVAHDAKVEVTNLKINRSRFKLGDRIELEFQIQSLSSKPQNLVVDYIIHFVKANQSTAPKVFKLKKSVLLAQEVVRITKSHHLKKVTTRTYFHGIHFLEVQVNGRVFGRVKWNLTQ